jgi:lincosamide nucleotidyltransferase A/C/D/E
VRVEDVHEVLDALRGLRVWLDGGWGVDALLGEQTREHSDVDVAIDVRDLPAAEERLERLGFTEMAADPGRPARVVLRDVRGRQVDLHPLTFDGNGDGWQELPDGSRGAYPGAELGEGAIGGREAPCISAELQLRHHSGYEATDEDRADVARLAALVKRAQTLP